MATIFSQNMLAQVLDPVCEHLTLGAWNKLARTSKRVRAAIDNPLYWEGRFGQFRADVMGGKGELHVYKTAECHCVRDVWAGPRSLSGVYAISLPVMDGKDVKRFMRYLLEEMRFLNYDLLPHLERRSYDTHIVVKLPMCRWERNGYVVAGKLKLIPYVFNDDGTSADEEARVSEMFETILEDPEDDTRNVLDEIVEELEPDNLFIVDPPPDGGMCPDCGREFEHDGMGGNFVIVGF